MLHKYYLTARNCNPGGFYEIYLTPLVTTHLVPVLPLLGGLLGVRVLLVRGAEQLHSESDTSPLPFAVDLFVVRNYTPSITNTIENSKRARKGKE